MALEDVEGYKESKAEHEAAVLVADRAGDELGKLKAENGWLKKEGEFRARFDAETAAETKLNAVKEQVKKDYPFVPVSLLDNISDPDALLQVAKDMAKVADPGENAAWGKPGGASGGGSGETDAGAGYSKREIDALVKRVNTGRNDPQAAEEYKKWVMDTRIFPFAKVDTSTRSSKRSKTA